MAERRETDDGRLQRLADLSIEIRMLKARVEASIERVVGDSTQFHDANVLSFVPATSAASCPHCGHPAGLALLPKEYRRSSTLVRCFGCHRDSAAVDWVVTTPPVRRLDDPQKGAGNGWRG